MKPTCQSSPPPSRSWHLSQSDRLALRHLIDSKPYATPGQLAKLFEIQTGRPVSKSTIAKARLRPNYGCVEDYGSRHLTVDQRDILRSICLESGPRYDRTIIADAFALRAGRPLAISAVSRFLREKLGVKPARRGPPKLPKFAKEIVVVPDVPALPCARCGTTGGRLERGKIQRTNAARFGVKGKVCGKCYDRLRYVKDGPRDRKKYEYDG